MSFLGQVRGAVDRVAGRAPGDVEGPALAAQKAAFQPRRAVITFTCRTPVRGRTAR